jgi:hypothetical protein
MQFARKATPMRTWQTIRTSALARHSHDQAYAALVFSGRYEEAGDHASYSEWFIHAVENGELRGDKLRTAVKKFFSGASSR